MNPSILIVEDEEALTLLLRYNLEAAGYEVDTVVRGDDADLRLKETIPDLVILLHLEPEIGLSRTKGDPDRMEQEDLTFHKKVGEAYLQLARQFPSRFAVIDGTGSIEEIHRQVRAAILPFIHEGP